MNQKQKEVFKNLLQALIPYWKPAQWFLFLMQAWRNDELINKVYLETIKQIKWINSEQEREKIKNALINLREKSDSIIKQDTEDAEKMINDLLINIQ